MKDKIFKTIEAYELIAPNDHVLVALSGGADSVVLLYALKSLGYNLFAAHINHMIRGEEASRDELFVISLCHELSVPLKVYSKNCPKHAESHKLSLEEAARVLRYEALEEARLLFGCQKIATAHTENDNIETMLMRLIRGTSPYGLRGIDIKREHIIRPLLYITRNEIIEYTKAHNLSYMSDSTNKDMNYLRNSVRHKLLPELLSFYNPNIKAALSRLSENLKTDADYFAKETESAFEKFAGLQETCITISAKAYTAVHSAVLERLIRKSIKILTGSDKDFDYIHTKMVIQLFTMSSGKRVNLTRGLMAANSFGSVVIYKENTLVVKEQALKPGDFIQAGGSDIFISLSREKINFRENFVSTCTGLFICDKIIDNIVVRSRKSGDIISMHPGKTIKLKDFLIEQKIPSFLRDSIPVVACGSLVLVVLNDKPYVAAEKTNCFCSKMYIELWRKLSNNG